MKEIWLRIKAETPIFWQKIRSWAIGIGGSAVALWTANTQLALELPVDFVSILKYIIVACVAIAGTATLTKTDV